MVFGPLHKLAVSAGLALVVIVAAGPSRADAPEVAATCQACHGKTGNSANPQYPSLAGQKPDYLRQQLEAFRSGARASAMMQPFAASMTDAQIEALVSWYSAQTPTPPSAPPGADAQRGAAIYLRGGRGVTACAMCHGGGNSQTGGMGRGMMGGGMRGGGMMTPTAPGITPVLFGQSATYLATQLKAFSDGTRSSPVMRPIASRLSPADRQAVADYLAGER